MPYLVGYWKVNESEVDKLFDVNDLVIDAGERCWIFDLSKEQIESVLGSMQVKYIYLEIVIGASSSDKLEVFSDLVENRITIYKWESLHLERIIEFNTDLFQTAGLLRHRDLRAHFEAVSNLKRFGQMNREIDE